MPRGGVVSVDLEPNLPALGSRIDSFARNLKPLGLRIDLPDFASGVEAQAGRSRRAVDSISTDKAQAQFRTLGSTADRELSRVESKAKLSSEALITMGAGSVYAGTRILGALRPATDAASDLNEAIAYSGQVFGSAADQIDRYTDTAAERLGQSKRQATEGATTFATFGKAAGLAGDDLVKFSTDLLQLSTDLASARNTKPEDAITAIGAALRGETEPIRAYGVLLDDATTRQEALALGITKTTKDALTPQQRVLAVQSLLFKQTSDAQGDFARTADSAANAQRVAAAEFENAQAKLGEGLTPVIATAAKTLTGFLNIVDKVPGATTALGVGLAGIGGAAILGGAVSSILGGVKAIRELRTGAAEAGATAVASNEAITATSTQAAAATTNVAAAYDAVTASAARAGAAAATAGAASTASSVGSSIVMGGNWQYARPRTPPAIGRGPVIDVTSREVLALESGVSRATAATASSTGVFSRWSNTVRSAGQSATNYVGSISPATARIGAFTLGTIALSVGLERANAQTEEGIRLLTQIGNLRSVQAAFDPENPERFAKSTKEIAGILSEKQYIEPQNWMDEVSDFFGGYDLSLFGDSQLSGNQAEAAKKLIDELKVSLEGLDAATGRRFLDGVREEMIATGLSASETDQKLKPLYDQLDDTEAADRATGALGELGTEVERLGVKIDPTASKWENFSTVLGGIFDPIQSALSAQQALVDGQEAVADAQKKYEDIVNGNTEGLRSAAEALNEARDDLAAATAEVGPGSRAARDAAQDVRDALRAYRDLEIEAGKTREGDFFDDRTQDLLDARDRIVEAQEKLNDIESGNTDEVRNARERLADAQQRYNEELANTGPNSEAARDALKEVEDAQARIIPLMVAQEQAAAALKEELEEHPEAIQASIDKVNEWLEKGLISVGVADAWKQQLLLAAAAAQLLTGSLPGNSSPATTNYGSADTQERRAQSSRSQTGLTVTQIWGPGGPPSFGDIPYVGGRASGGGVGAHSMAQVAEGAPELLHSGGRSYLMTGAQGGVVEPLSASSSLSDVIDAINGLRGDNNGLTAFLMRQASVGGGSEVLAPILMEIAELLRRQGTHRTAGDVRAMALEFA